MIFLFTAVDDAAMQMSGMPMPQQQAQQPPSAKMYASEKEFIELLQHKWDLKTTEERLLQKFGAKWTRIQSITSLCT